MLAAILRQHARTPRGVLRREPPAGHDRVRRQRAASAHTGSRCRGEGRSDLLGQETRLSTARAAEAARWLHLTRVVLPGLAATHCWPIHDDHCFMRVCLDLAIGAPWHLKVRRPALRHLDDAQLARAIAIAERIAAEPKGLAALNRESLAMRGKHHG